MKTKKVFLAGQCSVEAKFDQYCTFHLEINYTEATEKSLMDLKPLNFRSLSFCHLAILFTKIKNHLLNIATACFGLVPMGTGHWTGI
jgi:hypothetical protein